MLLPWAVAGTTLPGRGWRWFSAATIAATTLMLVLLQSRSAWLATAVAAAVALLTAIVGHGRLGLPRGIRRGSSAMLMGGVAIVLGGGVLTATDTPVGEFLRTTFVRRPHQAIGPTDGGRTMIWGITTRMIGDHPLTGVGAGNFTVTPSWASPGA
jgi:O-antigen ligase